MGSWKGSRGPFLCVRGALTQFIWERPHMQVFLMILQPASSEIHCCSSASTSLSFPMCSRPPAQVAVVLTLPYHPPGDYWVPGKGRRAGTSFHGEESDVPQTPNLDFSSSAMSYGLGLHWEYIFSCIFQAGILGSGTISGPPSLGQRSPYSALNASSSHSLSLACEMPLVLCMGMCLCSVSWLLKHLNKEFTP